jgi:hypothetical protein
MPLKKAKDIYLLKNERLIDTKFYAIFRTPQGSFSVWPDDFIRNYRLYVKCARGSAPNYIKIATGTQAECREGVAILNKARYFRKPEELSTEEALEILSKDALRKKAGLG